MSSLHASVTNPDASRRSTVSTVSKVLVAVLMVTTPRSARGDQPVPRPWLEDELGKHGVARIETLAVVVTGGTFEGRSAPRSSVNWTAPVAP